MFLCRIVWKYNIAGKPIYLPVRAGDLVNAIVICDDMFDDGIMVSLELFYLCDSDLTSTTMTQHYYKPLMYRGGKLLNIKNSFEKLATYQGISII